MFAIARTAALSALLGLILTGCASHPPRGNAKASGSSPGYAPRKSMFVPRQNSALAEALRSALTEHGWRLIGYDQSTNSGHANYQAMARRARYRLTLSSKPVGHCHDGSPGFVYRVTIIKNRSGDVPVSLSGTKCLAPIVGQFTADLDQKQLASAPRRAARISRGVNQRYQ